LAWGSGRAGLGARDGQVVSHNGRGRMLLACLGAGAFLAAVVPSSGSVQDSPQTGVRARRGPSRVRFAVIGDLGTGRSKQAEVAAKMCRWRRKHPFDRVITTGDNIYPDGSPELFARKFYEPYACLLNNGVRFHASLGNHDIHTDNGEPQLSDPTFGMKGRNYIVRRDGVRFVIADSNDLRRAWLKGAIRRRPGVRWTIVVFHHPVYSPGTEHGSTPGFRPGLPRLFRKRGVDLVLNGHDHLYAATRPLKGLRYVVTGGGGDKLYGCGKAWFSARCAERYHFLHVVASRDRITVRAVAVSGVFHRFSTPGLP
jgi:3',5'-cyclic AMP phosphodiesterase CpdA